MKSRLRRLGILFAIGCLFTLPIQGQDDDLLKDPDLQEALKQAKELEKQSGPEKSTKMSDLKKQADEILAEQKREEEKEKAGLRKRLEKQLAERGPVAFPDWTPATPEFKPSSSPKRKIVEDEVKLVQTGTSSLPPREILAAWEAAVADKPLNHFNNDITVNGSVTTRIDISSRADAVQKVILEARRAPDEKITQVIISSPLPKPSDEGE
jgi:hypothetical protein